MPRLFEQVDQLNANQTSGVLDSNRSWTSFRFRSLRGHEPDLRLVTVALGPRESPAQGAALRLPYPKRLALLASHAPRTAPRGSGDSSGRSGDRGAAVCSVPWSCCRASRACRPQGTGPPSGWTRTSPGCPWAQGCRSRVDLGAVQWACLDSWELALLAWDGVGDSAGSSRRVPRPAERAFLRNFLASLGFLARLRAGSLSLRAGITPLLARFGRTNFAPATSIGEAQ